MEEEKHLIKKVKKFDIKKTIIIILFFFLCYIFMELLNGNNIAFTKIFSLSTSFDEKITLIGNIMYDFFRFPKFIGNFLILIFLYLIIYGLTNKTKVACSIVSGAMFLFGIINYFVTQIRGIGITISDIYSIQTALNVAGGIKLNIDGNFIVATFIFIVINFALWKFFNFKEREKVRLRRIRLTSVFVGVLGMFSIFTSEAIMGTVAIWNINESYAVSGAGLTIMRLVKDLNIKKPAGYSEAEVKDILFQYTDETEDYSGDLPNVIVIMNESFADINDVYNINILSDNLPFYRQLLEDDNVISGVMHSSKYGGGTANVEYEFLTQNTTAFLPTGAVPYQQYVTKPVKQSIVSYMNKLNYNSYGIHSWYKNGYSRGKVYNFLGFNNSMFYEDMPNLVMDLSGYSSDWSTYEYLYDILENKAEDEREFAFIVTVQNHLPYFDEDADGLQFMEDKSELNTYLQYAYRSDTAIALLINYLDDFDEDTILLFFGDHQPNLNLQNQYSVNSNYSEEEYSYIVPFFIWANYDIEGEHGIETSTNYLQNILFDAAKMPKDSYMKYVDSLRQDIPVITSQYYIDKDGNKYLINDTSSPYYDKIQEYWKLIYYQMFDEK